MKIILAAFIVLFASGLIFFFRVKRNLDRQPPGYGLIEQAYYVCYKHKLLYGGIFGKGPTRKFSGLGKQDWCYRDEWEKINKVTFEYLAIKWYSMDPEKDQWSEFWRHPDYSVCNDLRRNLIMQMEGFEKREHPLTLEEISRDFRQDPDSVDVADILRLEKPEAGKEILKSMVMSKEISPFSALEAASVLAAWGDKSVVDFLQSSSKRSIPMTNSEIEAFLIKSSLLLLDQTLSADQLEMKSVFLHLEEAFDDCYYSQTNLAREE